MANRRRRSEKSPRDGQGAKGSAPRISQPGNSSNKSPFADALNRPPEIDNLSFSVRAQKFRIAATVMKRSAVPLATEYAIRLVHLVPDVTAEEIAAFFGFGAAETRVVIQDMLESQLVTERDGYFTLSIKGREAVSDQRDDVELFVTEEVTAHQCYDLIAFAPVEDAELTGVEARLVPEVAIPDRERAAQATTSARDAFDYHFQEWNQRNGPRRSDDIRLHAVEDVQSLRTFAAPFNLSVRYRLDDVAAGAGGVEPDFSSLRSKGRPGSRNALIAALSARVQSLRVPSDCDDAFALTARIDGGLLAGAGLQTATGQAAWASRSANEEGRLLGGAQGPGLRLLGSASSEAVREALLAWTTSLEAASIDGPTPVIWLPPRMDHWGRGIAFANLMRDLATANSDGTILFARTDGTTHGSREWSRSFGPKNDQLPLFDRCLAVQFDMPDALEVAVKPGAWALVLVYVPESGSGYPLAFGYLTTTPEIVSGWRSFLANTASSTAGPGAILWCSPGSTRELAFEELDLALGIEGGY